MKCGLLPISQHSQYVQPMVTYHDYEGIALNMDERSRMANNLGKTSKAMILRNHGLLTMGLTVHEAWEMMYYLDCACQIQIDAMSAGGENVLQMSDDAAKTAYEQFNRPNRPALTKSWPALLRMLDRRKIDYIN
jgi:ribulose-5-phosphate 4-epimerase/fuculose-1-phosphate aldolase